MNHGQPTPPAYPQRPGSQLPPDYEIKQNKRFYKRVWFWLPATVLVVIIAVVAGLSLSANDAMNKHHVVLTVTGGVKTADINYSTTDGWNKSQHVTADNVRLPWRKTVTVKGDRSMFILSARLPVDIPGKLQCELRVDGKLVATGYANDSVGVSCTGSGIDGK